MYIPTNGSHGDVIGEKEVSVGVEVEKRVVVGLAEGEEKPAAIIGTEEAWPACIMPNAEVVGRSIVEDTIEGCHWHASWDWRKRERCGGGIWEEEPRELVQMRGLWESHPSIMAHTRHVHTIN